MSESVSTHRTALPVAAAGESSSLTNRILLIEDCEEDIVHFQRLLRRCSADCGLDVITDGETAINWLAEKLAPSAARAPSLPRAIFLDLRLPGVPGREVLQWIRQKPEMAGVLVVVCSSSADLRDIAESEKLGADLYVTKFPRTDEFAALLKVSDPRSLRAESLRVFSR